MVSRVSLPRIALASKIVVNHLGAAEDDVERIQDLLTDIRNVADLSPAASCAAALRRISSSSDRLRSLMSLITVTALTSAPWQSLAGERATTLSGVPFFLKWLSFYLGTASSPGRTQIAAPPPAQEDVVPEKKGRHQTEHLDRAKNRRGARRRDSS